MNEIAAVILIAILVWLIVDGIRIRRMVKRVLGVCLA